MVPLDQRENPVFRVYLAFLEIKEKEVTKEPKD